MSTTAAPPSLEYTPARQTELSENIRDVQRTIDDAYASLPTHGSTPPRLVAVSKLKPASDILALYNLGYRHFGENYPQELISKSAVLPRDICWHFIGTLQSNKAKALVSGVGESLWVVETLCSEKTAGILEKAVASRLGTTEKQDVPMEKRLKVYIQVNTSSEDVKSGVDPLPSAANADLASHELVKLATYILTSCPHLHLLGLMTIGSLQSSTSTHPNPDFQTLHTTRDELFKYLTTTSAAGLSEEARNRLPASADGWELSMGMSSDFEDAVKQGSAAVRVGTKIFGERPKKVDVGGVTK